MWAPALVSTFPGFVCGWDEMSRGEQKELGPSIQSSLCNVTRGISMKSRALSYLTGEMWGALFDVAAPAPGGCIVLLNWRRQQRLVYLGFWPPPPSLLALQLSFPAFFFFFFKANYVTMGKEKKKKRRLTILLNDCRILGLVFNNLLKKQQKKELKWLWVHQILA